MSEALQKPPVVDLDVLLHPISDEKPSGESLRYTGLYDEIAEARRADENLVQGDWQTELKVADFRRVIDLAVPALSTETKDLQIAVWLTEALVKQHGFAGFRDSLKLLAGLQEKFWETLHPEIDDGDMEGRANAMAWLDTHVSFAIKGAPFTGSAGYSFLDWEDSKVFDIPENLDVLGSDERQKFTELKEQADRERRVTAEMWRKEKAATRRAAMEEINFTVQECWTALDDLNRVIEEKYDRNQAPGLSTLKKALGDVHDQIKKLLEEKRIEEPDPADMADDGDLAAASGGDGIGKDASGTGAIASRRDALKRLADLAAYFQKMEPHSPVSYLVQRAVKWGNMPLEGWLQDVIKDESILSELRQTLGFDTNESGDGCQ